MSGLDPSAIAQLESEWEPGRGFFWHLRQGEFRDDQLERTLATLRLINAGDSDLLPRRWVSLLWYAPIFMEWQRERVKESGVDSNRYEQALSLILAEIERILGFP